ncbi:MAG: hypothetical protein IAE91_01645 [Ignavibacteriaceae bacterium]|nr:hypothetical protein [Ignavibacteriaceae bacterium]
MSYSFEDIKNYVLGTINAQEKIKIEKAIREDPFLEWIKKDIESKKEEFIKIDKYVPSEKAVKRGYEKLKNALQFRMLAPGQIWSISGIGYVLLLKHVERVAFRVMYLSIDEHFKTSRDVEINGILNSPLYAHAGKIGVMLEHDIRGNGVYSGTITQNELKGVLKSETITDYTGVEEIFRDDYVINSEYIELKLGNYTEKALSFVESDFSSIINDILDNEPKILDNEPKVLDNEPKVGETFFSMEYSNNNYSFSDDILQNLSANKNQPEDSSVYYNSPKVRIYEDENLSLELGKSKNKSNLIFYFTFFNIRDAELKDLRLSFKPDTIHEFGNYKIQMKVSKFVLSDSEIISEMLVSTFDILFSVNNKQFTLKINPFMK